ncbi:MAG: fold metallo-hydrolase [Candidatus Peribacteria bacterium]|nr:fold metallo-hydrolase [Candidatus Peribacteria bacterium]
MDYMKITKLGHCCMLIEENGVRILTDPGAWTTTQLDVRNLDIILITHEHADHFHLDSLKKILEHNTNAIVVTNKSTGALLDKEGISYQGVDDGTMEIIQGIAISGHGTKHAVIYPALPNMENTGFFIANKFFFPGDSFVMPPLPVDILALPIAGPWMKLSEAIDYLKEVNPRISFPVHDGMIQPVDWLHASIEHISKSLGLNFQAVKVGEENEW